MKKIITMLMLVMFSISAYTQEWSVKNFSVAANDISASQYERLYKKKACALVKVLSVDGIQKAEGKVVGDYEKKGNETWVYMQPGSKDLAITVNDEAIFHIKFAEYGIARLESKVVYVLTIEKEGVLEFTNPVETFKVGKVSFKMIRVNGGTYTMGATPEMKSTFDDEYPPHKVTVRDFYIGETEVTQELYQAVMEENPSKFKGAKNPVEQVSWDEACVFIEMLSSITGAKFRIPTEAEWEYAARGGQKSKGYRCSGSNNANDVAWYEKNSGDKHHPVKTKKPNELGIYDMSGNVGEWVYDWYIEFYPEMTREVAKNPKGPKMGTRRTIKGSNYSHPDAKNRSCARMLAQPNVHNLMIGFRLAL